ncbi:hypothetical protein [Kosakonia cowanii]|uniref:hypothetical protein n=1 Tax=Kosakonia cowanii TaxID=208223 RepID=UPI00345BAFDC
MQREVIGGTGSLTREGAALFWAFIKANPFLLSPAGEGFVQPKSALQRAGIYMRMTAKELIADARVTAPTLPPAAAKLMTAMADRLDLQFVVLCESRNEAKQLAGENAQMKSAIKTHSESVHFCVGCGKDDPCSNDDVCYALEETPATDAFLASLRAEAPPSCAANPPSCAANRRCSREHMTTQLSRERLEPHAAGGNGQRAPAAPEQEV